MKNKEPLLFNKYTWMQVIKGLLLILLIYALLGSFFVNAPYAFYTQRNTAVNYSRIFFLHGLTVGLAGLTALFVSQTFNLNEQIKKIIFYFTIASVLIGVTAGAINRSMKYKITLWYQVLSLAALDVILITLFIGFLIVKNKDLKKTATYWLALASSFTAMVAGLIGDLAGFILDFGNWPGICGWYANAIGFTLPEWQDALVRAHSDMMVVAVLCLLISSIDWKFGKQLSNNSQRIRRIGEYLMILGIIAMLIVYLLSAFGGAGVKIPHLFTEKGLITPRGQSVRGIDLGDFIIGTFIFIGALLITGSESFGNLNLTKKAKLTIRGCFFTLCFIVLTVGGMGMLEEYRADLYNSDVLTTTLGNFGFAFRLLHVNVCLLLFPAIILLMLFGQQFQLKKVRVLQWLFRIGVVLCFTACIFFMIINPSFTLTNVGLWILYTGLACISLAICFIIFATSKNN